MRLCKKYNGILFFLAALFVISCKKEVLEEEKNIIEYQIDTVIISGNQILEDSTITSLTLEAYINKAYISLIGRKPDEVELGNALSILSVEFNIESRAVFLDQVLSNTNDFAKKIFDAEALRLLNGADTSDVADELFGLELILQNPSYEDIWPQVNYEINRLTILKNIQLELAQEIATIKDLHIVMVNNRFYDDINMGTENFVVSTFQNFLNRYPSTFELTEGKKMVDEFEAVLFLSIGASKNDYLNIFFNSDGYSEGLVVDVFNKYMLRQPNSGEIITFSQKYKAQGYKSLLRAVLSTNEYAGV